MLTQINISEYRKMRVWTDELPNNAYLEKTVRTLEYAFDSDGSISEFSAMVEFYAVVGPRSIYALLGGTIQRQQASSAELRLMFGTTEDKGCRCFQTPFVSINNEVLVGLPTEFGSGVIAGVETAVKSIERVPGGILRISHAAFSPVNSSGHAFALVANVLTRILLGGNRILSDTDLINLCPKELIGSRTPWNA